MPDIDQRIAAVTNRVIERSKPGLGRYLDVMAAQADHGNSRPRQSCGNFARGFAAASEDKADIVPSHKWKIETPARIFSDQDQVLTAFQTCELDRDVIVVVGFEGPRANGMPAPHKLTPSLAAFQGRGHAARDPASAPSPDIGTGRELFAVLRVGIDPVGRGASAMLAAMKTIT